MESPGRRPPFLDFRARLRRPGAATSRRPSPFDLPLPRPLRAAIEPAFGLRRLRGVYHALPRNLTPLDFAEQALAELGVNIDVRPDLLDRLATPGPLLVVANHPFGAIEGVALLALMLRARPDAKVLANRLLGRIHELRDAFVLVEILEQGKVAANGSAMRQALRHLKEGHALGMFPAGEVAHLHLRERRIVEPAWHAHLAGLVRRSNATVLPLHFCGRNGWMFQAAGLVHPRIRTLLLPRQLARWGTGRLTRLSVRVGRPVPPDYLEKLDPIEVVDDLYHRTAALAPPPPGPAAPPARTLPAPDAESLAASVLELENLPTTSTLLDVGRWKVVAANAPLLPRTLPVLGRLREQTFRLVGEGTGRDVDLDAYDARYTHVLLIDKASRQIAGAYRVGFATSSPRPDLYTLNFFRLPPDLLARIRPPVDLGRSFVRHEYQRETLPLMLLWKGVNALVEARGSRFVIGPVSVSARYAPASRAAIAAYLLDPKRRGLFDDSARNIRPTHPADPTADASPGLLRLARRLADLRQLDALVRDIEPDGRGLPVLLKQYLRLGAVPLAVNVDPDFGDCLDVLCVFDRHASGQTPVARRLDLNPAAA